MARLTIRHETLTEFLAIVLKLALRPALPLPVRQATHTRRLMNQAIFEAIWITDDDEVLRPLGGIGGLRPWFH
jgi:hypothetical protein